MKKVLALVPLIALVISATVSPQIGMPNPAAMFCKNLGGAYLLLGSKGYCVIEEWALHRKCQPLIPKNIVTATEEAFKKHSP